MSTFSVWQPKDKKYRIVMVPTTEIRNCFDKEGNYETEIIKLIVHYGQNTVQKVEGWESIAVGDIIEMSGANFQIIEHGYVRITENFESKRSKVQSEPLSSEYVKAGKK